MGQCLCPDLAGHAQLDTPERGRGWKTPKYMEKIINLELETTKTSGTSSSGISLSLHRVDCQILQLLRAALSPQHCWDLEPVPPARGKQSSSGTGLTALSWCMEHPGGAGLPPDPYSNPMGQKIIVLGDLRELRRHSCCYICRV